MVKIIKQGELPKNRKHRTSCNNCHTLFEFTESEATIGSDRNESFFKINCPFCHEPVYKDCTSRGYTGDIMQDH